MTDRSRVASSGHIIRSTFTLGLAQMITWVGAAALTVMLPQYLGDANLGKLTVAMALTTLTGLITDLGATTYLTKEVARAPERAGTLTVNLLLMRLPLSIIAIAICLLIVHLGNYDDDARHIVYVLTFGIVITAVTNMFTATLQGLQKMKILAACSILMKVGYAVLAVAFLFLGGGALWVSIAWVAVSVVSLFVSAAVVLRNVRMSWSIDFSVWRTLLFAGLPFFVWQAALLIYGQIDSVLLQFLTHVEVVGWYAAAYRIVMIPVFIPTILVTVIFPALSSAASNPPAFNAIARRAVHVVVLVSVPMALGIMLLPDKIIHLLNYPETFSNSVLPLVLLAPHLPLAAVDVMIGTVLNTRDRQRQWAMTAIAAAALNPAMNFLAIPYAQEQFGNGAIGAAAITTLTEVFMLVVGVRLLPRGVFGFSTVTDILKCVGAGAAMGVVVWLTRDYPIAVPIALGGLVYMAASLAVGSVSVGDINGVRMHLISRTAASGARTS
jgi:O-antigen/teichoic acid export membrane protein